MEALIPDKLGLWQREKETGSILRQWHRHAQTPPHATHSKEREYSEAPLPSSAGSHKASLSRPAVLQALILSHGILQAVLVESPCMSDIIEKVPESSRGVVNWVAVWTQADHDPSKP